MVKRKYAECIVDLWIDNIKFSKGSVYYYTEKKIKGEMMYCFKSNKIVDKIKFEIHFLKRGSYRKDYFKKPVDEKEKVEMRAIQAYIPYDLYVCLDRANKTDKRKMADTIRFALEQYIVIRKKTKTAEKKIIDNVVKKNI